MIYLCDEASHVMKAMETESAGSRQMIRFSLDVANLQAGIKATLSAAMCTTSMLRV